MLKKYNMSKAFHRCLIMLVLCTVFCSCKENKENDIYFESTSPLGKVKREGAFLEHLAGERLMLSQDIITAKAIRVKDDFLYISTSKKTQYIHKFNLKGEFQNALINKGHGPGEVSSIFNFNVGKDNGEPYLYVADLMQNKLLYQNAKDTLNIHFSNLMFDIVRLNDQNLIGIPIEEEKMFGIYNYRGELLSTFGQFPKNKLTDVPYILSQAYVGEYDYHETKKVFVAALRYTDQLMIFSDLDNDENHVVIRGPLFYDPIFKVSDKYGSLEFSQDEEGRFSFIDVVLTNDYIIGLFSGYSREERPGKAGFGDKIFLFDYSGKIINGFEISEKLISISYDDVNNMLYGLDVSGDEEEIFKYRLD